MIEGPSSGINAALAAFALFFDALDAMVKAQPMQAWSDYFTYHLVRDSAFAMGAAFDDEMFSMAKGSAASSSGWGGWSGRAAPA